MRLTKVEIEAFRAYNVRADFDCSADAVILVGSNGFGKTSFFDALAWCLFGEIRRLRGSRDAVGDDYVANRFASGGTPQVTLHFSDGARTASVTRRGGQLSIVDAGEEVRGRSAKQWIADLIRGVNLPRAATFEDAERVFTRCYLLGQEQMAAFLRETNPRERFDALSSLLGVDLVRSFYGHEQTVADQIQAEADGVRSELLRLNNRLEAVRIERERLAGGADMSRRIGLERIRSQLAALSNEAREALRAEAQEPAADTARGVAVSAEDLVARLKASTETTARRIDESRWLEDEWPRLAEMTSRLRDIAKERQGAEDSLAAQVDLVRANSEELKTLRRTLRGAEGRITQLKQDQDEFNSFLLLAKSHVAGDRCPVCEQGIDPVRVVRRLEERLRQMPEEMRQLSQHREALRREEPCLSG